MATIQNERDKLLQATTPRLLDVTIGDNILIPAVKGITLTAPSLTFKVNNAGVSAPTSILISAALKQITGTVSWVVTSGTATLTGSGNSRTLTYANLSSETATITASVTDGITYSSSITISKVRDGTNGTNGTAGVRGTVDIITTEAGFAGTWGSTQNTQATNAIASATGTLPIIGDRVTIRNSASSPAFIATRAWGGSWLTIGQYISGNLIVDGTIAGTKVVTNTLATSALVKNGAGWIYFGSPIYAAASIGDVPSYFTIASPMNLVASDAANPHQIFTANYTGTQQFLNSTVVRFLNTTGSAPFSVSSTTQVTNLNAQYVGGLTTASFGTIVSTSSGTATCSNGYNFTVIGVSGVSSQGSGNTFSVVNTSDENLKEDIQPEKLGLDFILKLKPVTYRYKQDNKIKYHGFIYQHVCSLFKEVDNNDSLTTLHEFEDRTFGGTDYMSIIAPLVNAVQELTARVKELEEQLKYKE